MTLSLGVPVLLIATGAGLLLPGKQPSQVLGVARVAELRDVRLKPGVVDPALAPGDLLEARDLEPLPVLDDVDELRGLEERRVGPRVEPGDAAPQDLGVEVAGLEVEAVQVRDLQLAALRGLEPAGVVDDL